MNLASPIPLDRRGAFARLACPPIGVADLRGRLVTINVNATRETAACYALPTSAFGLELKVAFLMETERAAALDERLRRVFYRLAQEPIIWSWWQALQQVPLSPDAMLNLASILNGATVTYRYKEMHSAGEPGRPGLRYEAQGRARSWLADIAAADEAGGDPIKTALYRYARIVIAHPFTDANGRMARAALQGGLARADLIATPCLALAPAFYLHAANVRDAIGSLSRSGHWPAYFDTMGSVLADSLAWVARIP